MPQRPGNGRAPVRAACWENLVTAPPFVYTQFAGEMKHFLLEFFAFKR
jgi:hypothetical protein